MDKATKIKIGGVMQKIHIVSRDEANPVILFIHGGPGGVNRHDVLHNHTDLLDRFTLVGWDQRGVGGSYTGVDFDTLTMDRVVEDAAELTARLCGMFGKDKIFILGLSWGSCVGTLLAARHPEHVAAYVGYGQLVNGHLNELLSYRWTLEQAEKLGDSEGLEVLKGLGEPYHGRYRNGRKDLLVQRGYLKKYGGFSPNSHATEYYAGKLEEMKASGEYTRADIKGYLAGKDRSAVKLWEDIGELDFPSTNTKFEVPFFIFHGKQDMNTPWTLIPGWFEKIEAPQKDLVFFENSGHNPLTDEPGAFKKALREHFEPIIAAAKCRI
ncbi:MAG: alpha/beta hydrolase [Firmicutes bacterium]|nr:alpha/beta hydrolase [Bacillota bacterium]